ncbi:MAG TPA: hypothetical protein VF941_05870 [Clostridia bacterium]
MNERLNELLDYLAKKREENLCTVESVIGKKALSVLQNAGITDLHVEEDGTISGERSVERGLPQVDYIKNLSVQIINDRPVINGQVTRSVTDVGKVI